MSSSAEKAIFFSPKMILICARLSYFPRCAIGLVAVDRAPINQLNGPAKSPVGRQLQQRDITRPSLLARLAAHVRQTEAFGQANSVILHSCCFQVLTLWARATT